MVGPSSGNSPTAQPSLWSDCTVPKGKPGLLVQQLLLQFNVGCSHKRLLALHCHFQHHSIQQWDVTVLQLRMRGKYFSWQTEPLCFFYTVWHFSETAGFSTWRSHLITVSTAALHVEHTSSVVKKYDWDTLYYIFLNIKSLIKEYD